LSQNELMIGAAVTAVSILLTLLFSVKKAKTKTIAFRKLPAAFRLRRAIGLAVEDGTRLHVSLGSSSLIQSTNTSALTALATLDRIEQLASTSDQPPICTSGDGGFQMLSHNVIKQNTVESNTRDQMDASLAQMSGATSFAYAVGAADAMHDAGVSANVYMGKFGPEAGLLCDAAEEKHAYTIAGSNSITGQAVFFALADDPLIGEELYALPAYLGAQVAHQASLRVEDILRFLIILLMVGSLIVKVMNLL
jgi:hypothetical protein